MDGDPGGVDAERGGIGAHPAEGGLHVVYLGGPLRFAREAVGSRDADVTEAAKEDAVAAKLGRFALGPAAAVDEEDAGSVPGGARRRENVVAELTAVDGVDEDVLLDGNTRRIRGHGMSPGGGGGGSLPGQRRQRNTAGVWRAAPAGARRDAGPRSSNDFPPDLEVPGADGDCYDAARRSELCCRWVSVGGHSSSTLAP